MNRKAESTEKETGRRQLARPFVQVCVWPGTTLSEDQTTSPEDIAEFEAFFAREFSTRVKFIYQLATLPDMENGLAVPGTGGRNDLFFAVHEEDVYAFSIKRLACGIRWIEDVLDPGNYRSRIYPDSVYDLVSWADGPKAPAAKKPIAKLVGEGGNVFNLIGIVASTLRKAGLKDQAKEMTERVTHCGSYDEALTIFYDYVEVE